MRKVVGFAFVCLAVSMTLMTPHAATAAPILYGVTSSSPGRIYTIDPLTGAATLQTTMSVGTSLVGAEFYNGNLWVTDVNNITGWRTGTVDLNTGVFTSVSSQAGSSNWHSLAVDEGSGIFYTVAVDQAGAPLKTMTTAGTTATIGSTNVSITGLAFSDSSQILYGTNGFNLYMLSTVTGAASVIGSLGVTTGGAVGLAYSDVLGTLFMTANSNLYSVSTLTGAAVLIGTTGVTGQMDGLAVAEGITPVPEPASLVLLTTGMAGMAAKVHRRRRRQAL